MIAASYERGGAACLSVLTDQQFFPGLVRSSGAERAACALPVAPQGFHHRSHAQVYEARAAGADCILLIAAALEDGRMLDLGSGRRARRSGVGGGSRRRGARSRASPQNAAHRHQQRNLRTFDTRLETTFDLLDRIPAGRIVVTESGILAPGDVRKMRAQCEVLPGGGSVHACRGPRSRNWRACLRRAETTSREPQIHASLLNMPTLDDLIIAFDRGLRTVFGPARSDAPCRGRAAAARDVRVRSAPMRRRSCGSITRGSLRPGPLSRTGADGPRPGARAALDKAAQEETEHLAWTERRIEELGGRKSVLNPLFYAGSFAIGAAAGLLGDRWNLGFLAETERQVVAHLEGHLTRLPEEDQKSRAVVEQMQIDEAGHATSALSTGERSCQRRQKPRCGWLPEGDDRNSSYWI